MQKTLHSSSWTHDLVAFVSSLVMVILALVGMGGIAYHALAPDGLFSSWLGRLWSNHPAMTVLLAIGLIATGLTARASATSYRSFKGGSDLPLYVFVGLGTFFAAHWLW